MRESAQQFKLWQRLQKRLYIYLTLAFLTMLLLVARLFTIQVLNGEKYYELSQRVIRKVVTLPAPRGEMFDRYYESRTTATRIVSNQATLNLVVVPSHFKKGELFRLTKLLERKLDLPEGELTAKLTPSKIRKNEEIVLIDGLTERQQTILADYYLTFSRFIIRQSTSRFYNFGEAMAHITGYIGPPSKKDIEAGLKSYQKVGKNGLELYYDRILRGEDGEIVQLKTARGNVEEQKVFKNFIPGNNLILTIDSDLQKLAYEHLKERKGAVIAIAPATGEVYVLASSPSYDPNILVSGDAEQRKEHLLKIASEQAELNRAISAKYPPASTFKPLVALAALEEKRASKNTRYFCSGKFVLKSTYKGLPDAEFYCWRKHGWNNLVTAIQNSCSAYFYQLGYHIGSEPIIKYARYFMLNRLSGIDLPGEIAGFIPSPLWKEKKFNQRWFDGDTVNLSIGQGFIQTTLIGMVDFYAALATGGIVYKPHLVKEIRYADNDKIKEKIEPTPLYELPISNSTLKVIKEGLLLVTQKGTARGSFGYKGMPLVMGKTGTVQTRSDDRFANATQHAWFIGIGPLDKPIKKQLVIGVFVERGIGGAVSAAPIAAKLFVLWEKKLKGQKKSPNGQSDLKNIGIPRTSR
ncbi:MAG: penicillin-binding protein 2 [Candidatus Hydrogenedentota bacterium]|nr:MAG: penicillin-binding protein 2 [Candidatus Hydrogenedentota bacterium]